MSLGKFIEAKRILQKELKPATSQFELQKGDRLKKLVKAFEELQDNDEKHKPLRGIVWKQLVSSTDSNW